MSDANAPSPEGLPAPVAADGRLDSWKEIAAYLKRDTRTVQRWEKLEGLPIRRHQQQKRGSAFAYRDELDAWWLQRGHDVDAALPAVDASDVLAGDGEEIAAERPHPSLTAPTVRRRVLEALPWIVACVAVAIAGVSLV